MGIRALASLALPPATEAVSVTVTRDVFCDECGDWTHGVVNEDAKAARRVARREGWVYRKGKDLCPQCKGK